jgi:hypothetical protein
MWNMNDVTEVKHVNGFTLYVEMDDGLAGQIDLSAYPAKGPIFEALADIEFFKRVSIEGGTLAWPNGADISPESVYELLENVNKSIEVNPVN